MKIRNRAPQTARNVVCVLMLVAASTAAARDFYVSPNGNDANPGTRQSPWATIAHARDALRGVPRAGDPLTVIIGGGTYHLSAPIVFGPMDSGTQKTPVAYRAAPDEKVNLSGARLLTLKWRPYKNGILQANVPAARDPSLSFDQLFVDGRLQHMARYPNFDPRARYFGGVAADAISPKRIKTWAHPETAYFHALHGSHWGSLHYRITGVDKKGNAILEGGWQTNRPSGPDRDIRFVENVFEELDAPGEWFCDHAKGVLYFLPPAGMDMAKATVEVAGLKSLVEFRGSGANPVRWISLSGIHFTQTARTFLEKYEPLLRDDWSIYRGGAVFLQGSEDCSIADCDFDELGGNALFVNGHNRRFSLSDSRFTDVGASGVCFVGLTSSVRTPTSWSKPANWATMDRTPGPKTDDYPADCRVQDCLLFNLGTVEKQIAAVEISMAARITVSHCSIYDLPRAGVNIGDGDFGGDVIEFCDVFNTVRETGDHGSFNSWGRDRYWNIQGISLQQAIRQDKGFPFLDVVEPITLRNNRWRCDNGWDIDLDDGSSNYHIYNNLCLHGGIKNREGFNRDVENNIIVDNSFHAHVWYPDCHETFQHNIVTGAYRPIDVKEWGDDMDYNFFTHPSDLRQVQDKYHTDAHSMAGDPMFIDPTRGDYRVKPGSPALKVGFKNFPMDQFGVTSPRLKAEAKTPWMGKGDAPKEDPRVDVRPRQWLGGVVRNISGADEQSVYGLPEPEGVLIVSAAKGSKLQALGLKAGDVIVGLGTERVGNIDALEKKLASRKGDKPAELIVIGGQTQRRVAIK